MVRKDYDMLITKLNDTRHDLHLKKSEDYATEDVLSNFKRCSSTARNLGIGMDAADYAIFMAAMKLDRIQNIRKSGKTPNNESLEDSIIDAVNYIELAYAIMIEESEEADDRDGSKE
jgi:hypothetical protein